MTKRKRPFPPPRPARTEPQGAAPGPRSKPGGLGPSYWIYGFHAVKAALDNPARRVRRLLVVPEAAAGLGLGQTGGKGQPGGPGPAGRHPAPETVDRAALDRSLPAGAVHQGVGALVDPLDEPDLDTVLDGLADATQATILLLDQVTDPQNIGAVLRSAAAFGAAAVIVPRHHAPPVTGALAKAASGAVEHVALVRVGNLVQALERLGESGFWSVALAGDADRDLASLDLTGRIVLALGAEGAGLRRLTRERCDHQARLPTGGAIGHLNVSNAAAVALYECARQRSAKP